MNNNGTRKTSGSIRFTPKMNEDGQDASLIEHEDDVDILVKKSLRGKGIIRKSPKRHTTRITMDQMGVKVQQYQATNCKLKCFVFLCGVIIVVGMVLILHFYHNRPKLISIGDGTLGLAQLSLSQRTLSILDHMRLTKAEISIGGEKFPSLNYKDAKNCGVSSATMSGMCLTWPAHGTKLWVDPVTVTKAKYEEAVQCYRVSWSFKPDFVPEDCIFLDDVKDGQKLEHHVWMDTQKYVLWPEKTIPSSKYDNNELKNQVAPCKVSCHQYSPGSRESSTAFPQKNMGETVVEPLWISSQSVLIKASLHNPLLVCTKLCHNATRSTLCLKTIADESHQLQSHPLEAVSNLTYVTCVAHNTSMLYQEAVDVLVRPPSVLPPSDVLADVVNDGVYYEEITEEKKVAAQRKSILSGCSDLLKKPLWNIVFNGVKYDSNVIESELQHLKSIGGTGYMHNISDIFTEIGDFSLRDNSKVNFLDVVQVLHKMDFSVMIPLSPFVNYNSTNFRHAVSEEMLVKNEDVTAPILTDAPQFGNKVIPGIIDFTNPNASKWFIKNAVEFKQKYKIDHIHLFYGQASWLPKHYHLFNSLHNPSFYSTLYTNAGNYICACPVTDVAYSSQGDNQFVMLNAVMDLERTLQVALGAGLAGYPFFIPNLPSHLKEASVLGSAALEEGFIRWIQLVSFFPVAHIPWDYHVLSNMGVNMTKLENVVQRYSNIRNGPVVWPAFEAAIRDAEATGSRPIVAPVWMAPGIPKMTQNGFDKAIYQIQDQFMIGNDLMFAPILVLGQQKRDVYLPPGQWKELLQDREVQSNNASDGYWTNYSVDLDNTLIFVRIK